MHFLNLKVFLKLIKREDNKNLKFLIKLFYDFRKEQKNNLKNNGDKLSNKKRRSTFSTDSSLSSLSSNDEASSSLKNKNNNLSERLLNEAAEVLNQGCFVNDSLRTAPSGSQSPANFNNSIVSPCDFVGDLIKEKLSEIKDPEEV